MKPEEILKEALHILEEGNIKDIEVMDLRGKNELTSFMLVGTGTSSRHNNAIADKLADRMKETGIGHVGIEGKVSGDWILVDAGDVIAHIFREEARAIYNIEDLWSFTRSEKKP